MRLSSSSLVFALLFLSSNSSSSSAQNGRFWQPTNCRTGQMVTAMVANDSLLVVGLMGVGVSVLTLGTDQWLESTEAIPARFVSAVAIGLDGTLYVGT